MATNDSKKGSILLIKGVDISNPAEYIDDSSSRNSENFELSRGVLNKRVGSVKLGGVIGGTDTEIMGGTEFNREDVNYNVRVGLKKIERYNTTTSAWVDITDDDLTGTTTDLVSTATPLLSGKPILCITNGVDPIQKWTGSGAVSALGGTPPVAKFIQEYKTYLVCANIAGGTDVGQRVQWSDTSAPETWDSGNAGAVDLVEDGESITGLSLFGNYLCVHKERSIYLGYLVSGEEVFQFDRKSTGVGTIADGSIQNLPSGEQIFLAKDGLYLFNGVTCKTLSPAINEEIRDSINAEYASKAWSVLVRSKKEVWIGIPLGGDSYGETVYKYNYETGIVMKDIRSKTNTSWIGQSTAGLSWDDMVGAWDEQSSRWDGSGLSKGSDVVNFSTVDGYTYAISETVRNDDETAVYAKWDTKDYQDSQQRISRFNSMELWAKGSSVTIEYSVDQGETWIEITGSPHTLTDIYPSLESPDIFYFDVVSSTIRFRFSNNNLNEALSIKQFIINYIPREMRK
jgi:hypothetical protein